ncbi:hypothetical protein PHYBLDRAFT_149562 [Phycomyces blakesleeanus NRRL 1555(-)]|uniref:Uncharacterized protein n=1 Tax=Phycomyces blakesleeanus (strain ATCC 8743b / DSM 1359 / FGSC 10004 / NBRC 33097 / NRRL 1555) TaxID=763407 RepID=A0A167KY98_PHYB8|nr:hypothetical protein PHYBLDRAFT_149562 [Phycomyces blakesleeanus NRRL 1555(-)]OAD69159.1 hypothetical protein PHYBLDRAFT_149562 [Phycomyces blakesleeanus NRRL 1555(-)]|eukprot:XP_018287199.1 hypothetical protein PHYBLDRAFT_149562 [Phycomyces blakesleeanus NRRL 1555(-)]
MNDTDNIIESLLLAIQLQLSVLRANQEQIKMDINSLGNEIMIKGSPKQNLSLFINISSGFVFKPVINISTLPSVQALGPRSSWGPYLHISPDAIKIGHPLQESVISGKTVKGGNSNKAARATTTTTTTTANDNSSNIDSAEQTNAGKIFALMQKRSQGIDNSDADLSSKSSCLNTVQVSLGDDHTIDEIYEKISEVNTFLRSGKTTITSEDIEAEASKAVEQALSPECYPVLDQLLQLYIQEEQLYEKYDKTQSTYFEANRHIIKSVVDYLRNQAEGKLITPGKIKIKVLRYISSQKLKRKKTGDQTAETNQVECLSQRRVQIQNKRALALETDREYFVKTYGEGLDDFLHADYMSDLETDCEVADNSSSADQVFGRFRSSWRSEKGDNFIEELDAIYQNIPKGSQTRSFDRKIFGRREKKLTNAKMKKLPS